MTDDPIVVRSAADLAGLTPPSLGYQPGPNDISMVILPIDGEDFKIVNLPGLAELPAFAQEMVMRQVKATCTTGTPAVAILGWEGASSVELAALGVMAFANDFEVYKIAMTSEGMTTTINADLSTTTEPVTVFEGMQSAAESRAAHLAHEVPDAGARRGGLHPSTAEWVDQVRPSVKAAMALSMIEGLAGPEPTRVERSDLLQLLNSSTVRDSVAVWMWHHDDSEALGRAFLGLWRDSDADTRQWLAPIAALTEMQVGRHLHIARAIADQHSPDDPLGPWVCTGLGKRPNEFHTPAFVSERGVDHDLAAADAIHLEEGRDISASSVRELAELTTQLQTVAAIDRTFDEITAWTDPETGGDEILM